MADEERTFWVGASGVYIDGAEAKDVEDGAKN